ncbi:TRAP transporter small permease subunit [Lutibaculum baratangense]|uniref:TRAP transporter small permease protein n=1 Tax=Lutibaculum baratangense AMV1 TaxID=631454 RepID=V4QWM0_9HYPH|nr:TRAP transporter small permease [Lutibaculum baratangense]ESR24147.1 TRAP dicarboxylate family transporter, DctQ subunit [Lutibaculum baratangense AMV1]
MDENIPAAEAPREHGESVPEAGRLGRWLDRGGIVFAAGIVLAMLILMQEVILRYVFNAPTIWAHETTVFLCGIAFIYGGLYCTARDRHIRVVLIYDALGPRLRRAFDVAISIVCAAASAMFAWAAWLMVERAAFRPDGSFRLERSGSAWDPVYPGLVKVFLMVVLAVMAIQFVVLAWNYAKGRR